MGSHRLRVPARNEHLGLLATAAQSWPQTAELVGGHGPRVPAGYERQPRPALVVHLNAQRLHMHGCLHAHTVCQRGFDALGDCVRFVDVQVLAYLDVQGH